MNQTSILGPRVDDQRILAGGEETAYLQQRHYAPMIGGTESRARVIFVLGRPGSGKSTIVKALKARLKRQGWKVITFDDYLFLLAMAEAEKQQGANLECPAQFSLLAHEDMKGFIVRDFAVLEQVLCQINRRICEYLWLPETVILVEFARDEYIYDRVWKYFSHQVRMSAHYLFCEAELGLCIERVKQRAQFVALEVMRSYYKRDGLSSLLQNCNRERLKVINTEGAMRATHAQVTQFLEKVGTRPVVKAERTLSQETMKHYGKSSRWTALEGEGGGEVFTRLQA